MASPSSGDSERNSPDSVRSFTFRGDDEEYDAYSRFGSIASIATSESSINSSYYAEIGGAAVDHHSAEERRDAWYVPPFFFHSDVALLATRGASGI
jgi:hypothetical protein